MVGVVGRETGETVLRVVERTDTRTLMEFVLTYTIDDATIFTDEWPGYRQLPDYGRGHETVTHAVGHREWARDVDGDGIREVHNNTMEGLWAGLRNFLRPFRGVSKYFLYQYVAVFNWTYNWKVAVPAVVRALLGLPTTLTAS